MKWLHVSETAHRALADAAIYPWYETGRRQEDGSWLIPVDDEVAERLDEVRLDGESDDDLIMRMIREHRGDKPS
jgi:hypothetical protein